MKKVFFALAAGFILTGCLETTQEITLKEDGTGSVNTSSDMSTLIELLKTMGGSDMEKAGEKSMDTTIALTNLVDSIRDISAEEKAILSKGVFGLKLNLKEGLLKSSLNYPFKNSDEISTVSRLTNKVIGTVMKDEMASSPMAGGMGGDMPEVSSIDNYYKLHFEKGEIKRTLDKERYAGVSTDEYLNSIKQATAMGLEAGNTLIINLPKPAEKVEGKNARLSEDKMKVIVKASLDEFFDTPEALEFKVKY